MNLLAESWFQWVLAGATLLGGASALWYFRSELLAWLRRQLAVPAPAAGPRERPTPHAADAALFERILEFLPFEPVGRFLQQHNFAASFEVSEWAGIHDYLAFADSPECRFQDSSLEVLRVRLTSALNDFIQASSGKIWSAHGDRMLGVPDEWDFKGHVNYGKFWPAVEALNPKARKAYAAYELFVQKARSVLLRR